MFCLFCMIKDCSISWEAEKETNTTRTEPNIRLWPLQYTFIPTINVHFTRAKRLQNVMYVLYILQQKPVITIHSGADLHVLFLLFMSFIFIPLVLSYKPCCISFILSCLSWRIMIRHKLNPDGLVFSSNYIISGVWWLRNQSHIYRDNRDILDSRQLEKCTSNHPEYTLATA